MRRGDKKLKQNEEGTDHAQTYKRQMSTTKTQRQRQEQLEYVKATG